MRTECYENVSGRKRETTKKAREEYDDKERLRRTTEVEINRDGIVLTIMRSTTLISEEYRVNSVL